MKNNTTLSLEEAAKALKELGHPVRLSIYRQLVRAGADGTPVGTVQAQLGKKINQFNDAQFLREERLGQIHDAIAQMNQRNAPGQASVLDAGHEVQHSQTPGQASVPDASHGVQHSQTMEQQNQELGVQQDEPGPTHGAWSSSDSSYKLPQHLGLEHPGSNQTW